jgi:hypothetical protein
MAPLETTVVYGGGSTGHVRREYVPSGACTIVSAGTWIRCPTTPGVGANYTFVVSVGGGVSDPSARALSYAQPVIRSVDGRGAVMASPIGGAPIVLRGSNFGPVDSSTQVRVWAVPTADETLSFPGLNCAVVEAHTSIACIMSAVMGSALTWQLTVEGLANVMPQTSVAPPVVLAVSFVGEGVTLASTLGGTAVAVFGTNFGVRVDRTRVTATLPSGVTELSDCVMITVDTQLRCVLPAGTGAISRITVTVLDQAGALDTPDLAYAPPSLASVSPGTWSTDLSSLAVVVGGSGFGRPAQSNFVSVSVTGVTGCMNDSDITVDGTAVTVLSDAELSVTFQLSPAHVLRRWSLSVTVSGQSIAWNDTASRAVAVVSTRAPSVSALSFAVPPNGTHYFVLVEGFDFGPSLSDCADDVQLSVDGQPCLSVTMQKVCDLKKLGF